MTPGVQASEQRANVRAYLERYEALARFRREESRLASSAEKFRQFLSIMALADEAGWLDDRAR